MKFKPGQVVKHKISNKRFVIIYGGTTFGFKRKYYYCSEGFISRDNEMNYIEIFEEELCSSKPYKERKQ